MSNSDETTETEQPAKRTDATAAEGDGRDGTDADGSDGDSSDDGRDAPGNDAEESETFTVTPYEVEGEIDYGKLVERFGADPLTDEQVEGLPDHPLVRRGTFYAGRDVEGYLEAARAGDPHAVVTGRGPSGPMHLGHVVPLYLAKRFQEETGATVYLPVSDDKKFLAKEQSFESIGEHTRANSGTCSRSASIPSGPGS